MTTSTAPFIYFIALAGAIVVALNTIRVSSRRRGPTPLPLVGDIFTMRRLAKDVDKELLRIRDKWGDVCMPRFGAQEILLVNSPRAAKELLNERSMIYSSRPKLDVFGADPWPGRLVLQPAGELFRRLRRLYHRYLSPQQSLTFRQHQREESLILLLDILDHPEAFLRAVERYAMSVMFNIAYGVRIGTLPNDMLPALTWLPKKFQPLWSKLSGLARRERSIHLACLDTEQKQENLSDDQISDTLAVLLGGGADTSTSILQTFFKIMALHPEVMRSAQSELDQFVGCNRVPTWEDEPSLSYIRSLIKEVNRWAPISSLGVPHCATADDIYQDLLIREGTVIFPNIISLSMDPERYLDPEKFEPTRFRNDELGAAASAQQKDFMRRDHFQYGFGRRMCPGVHVAEASLFIVISRLLWCFNIELDGSCPVDIKDRESKLYPTGITARSD
ncbi:MAG: hypothetical protein Q9227_008844 [Pyrenula ochraceoflavens]